MSEAPKYPNTQSIELRPHQVESVLNKFDAPRVRVFERVISPELKKNEDGGSRVEDGITAAEILRDAKGIVARALARGAAKIVPDHNGNNTRNYAHKTGRRWTKKQRAGRSRMLKKDFRAGKRETPNQYAAMKTPDCGLQTAD